MTNVTESAKSRRDLQAKKTRVNEIALIHVAKRQLGMDDGTYRAMLQAVTGIQSSADLTPLQRTAVLAHLKTKGFKIDSIPASKNAKDPAYRKIRALWKQLHQAGAVASDTDQAVRAYIKRITRASDFGFLNQHQVATVIESLKKWAGRIESGEPQSSVSDSQPV